LGKKKKKIVQGWWKNWGSVQTQIQKVTFLARLGQAPRRKTEILRYPEGGRPAPRFRKGKKTIAASVHEKEEKIKQFPEKKGRLLLSSAGGEGKFDLLKHFLRRGKGLTEGRGMVCCSKKKKS